MHQTVDAAVQANEDTEISNGFDFAADLVAFGASTSKCVPWVFLALFQAKRDTTTFFVDIQHHNFDFITQVNHFRRMNIFVGPIHFRNVDQAFNALFQLSETAVVSEVGDFRFNTGTFRVTLGDLDPRIFTELFQAQRHTIALAVEFQNLNVDLVANIDDFAWMLDTLPRHVGNVQQTIYTAQVYECAVVGQIFNNTFNCLAFLQASQQLVTLNRVGLFEHSTARNYNVVALLVELDNFEFQLFTFKVSGFAHRANVNQRTWEEGTDACNVNGETTFNFAIDNAFDNFVCRVCCFKDFPSFSAF